MHFAPKERSIKYLTPDQFDALTLELRAWRSTDRRSVALLLELIAMSGIRLEELCRLTVNSLCLEAIGQATVNIKHPAKDGRPRKLPIPLELYHELLKECSAKNVGPAHHIVEILGLNTTAMGIKKHLRKAFKRVAAKQFCGLDDLGPHALRHTFAIRLFQRTKDLRIVQYALGHKSINTTMVYLQIVDHASYFGDILEAMGGGDGKKAA